MAVYRRYKTELRPNNRQTTLLLKNAGAARWAYNWGLVQKKAALDAKRKVPSAVDLHKQLVQLKKTDLPWMYEVSKCSPHESLRNLDKAFARFWKGRRSGRKVGFPKFKSKRKSVGNFSLNNAIKATSIGIRLPRLGTIRLKERGYIPTNVKILNATVSEKAGRWFVSVLVEAQQPKCSGPKDGHYIVGVDLGVKTLATVSDGTAYENPKPLRKNLKKLKRLQRAVARKQKGSKNRKKSIHKVAKLHAHIANIRKDTLHKITTHLTKTKSVIGIEDLNVSGMLKNRKLSRAISDVGFGEFRRQLEYKAKWYGCQIVLVDRFFPSSKACSVCGEINDNLKLLDRTWTCPGCKTTHDRDLNAACNLEYVAASSAETQNACGEKSSSQPAMVGETSLCEAGMKPRT